MTTFELSAEVRHDKGKGASRRLRRAKKVPGIIYGGNKEPLPVALDSAELTRQVNREGFFSNVLSVKVDGKQEKVIVRDIQRHPHKPLVEHMDFQRILESEALRVHVPLHFVGEENSPGVKHGGVVSHNLIELEIECLPRNIPEAIEVDMSNMDVGDSIHISELNVPKDVTIVALTHGEEYDDTVVSIHHARVSEPAAEEAAEEEAGGEETGAGEEAE